MPQFECPNAAYMDCSRFADVRCSAVLHRTLTKRLRCAGCQPANGGSIGAHLLLMAHIRGSDFRAAQPISLIQRENRARCEVAWRLLDPHIGDNQDQAVKRSARWEPAGWLIRTMSDLAQWALAILCSDLPVTFFCQGNGRGARRWKDPRTLALPIPSTPHKSDIYILISLY